MVGCRATLGESRSQLTWGFPVEVDAVDPAELEPKDMGGGGV